MSHRRDTDYVAGLGEPGDVLTVRFTSDRGNVVAFTVQYEAWISGRRYPVVRCDTAHGFAHWDTLAWNRDVVVKMPVATGTSYNEMMTVAIAHLRTYWRGEREAFIRRKP